MIRNLRFYSLAFVAIVFVACKNGITVESYDQGSLYERYSINQDSVKHGLYSRFYKSGKIAEKASYQNGLLDGVRTLYYDTGAKEIEEVYQSDSLHGEYKTYYPSGKVEFVCEYVNNKIQGKSKKYYESGKLLEEVIFKDNNENGPFVEYYENGEIEWKGQYLNGDNEFGLLENYNNKGELIKKMMCDSSSVCKTIWTKGQQN